MFHHLTWLVVQIFLFSRDAEHLVVAVDAVLPGLAAGQRGDGQRVLGVPGVGAHRGPGRGGPVAGHRAPGIRALTTCFQERFERFELY